MKIGEAIHEDLYIENLIRERTHLREELYELRKDIEMYTMQNLELKGKMMEMKGQLDGKDVIINKRGEILQKCREMFINTNRKLSEATAELVVLHTANTEIKTELERLKNGTQA